MKTDRIILGEGNNCVFRTNTEETQLNNNLLVCGSSGSGKTMSITEMRLLETYNSSLIVNISKRKLVEKYTPLFKNRGYNVLDLNFVNPANSNISYDPLHYINNYLYIIFLAESIVKANPQKQNSYADPYWDQCAISLLAAEISYVLTTKNNPTFNDILNFHASLEFKCHIDSNTAQKIATNLWKAYEKVFYSKGKRIHLKKYGTFESLEGKSNKSGIRFKDNHLEWLKLK